MVQKRFLAQKFNLVVDWLYYTILIQLRRTVSVSKSLMFKFTQDAFILGFFFSFYCICCTQSNMVGRYAHWVGLQTTNPREEEFSCATCLCSLQFRVSLRRCRAHPCTMESSSALCKLFLTLEAPTATVWLALQLQLPPCAAVFLV